MNNIDDVIARYAEKKTIVHVVVLEASSGHVIRSDIALDHTFLKYIRAFVGSATDLLGSVHSSVSMTRSTIARLRTNPMFQETPEILRIHGAGHEIIVVPSKS